MFKVCIISAKKSGVYSVFSRNHPFFRGKYTNSPWVEGQICTYWLWNFLSRLYIIYKSNLHTVHDNKKEEPLMKKTLCLLLALCMLMALTACGAKTEAPATTAAPAATEAPAAT